MRRPDGVGPGPAAREGGLALLPRLLGHARLGVAVVTAPDAISPGPGRFGWWGGTAFFADPASDTVTVLMFQPTMESADDTAIGNEFLKLALNG